MTITLRPGSTVMFTGDSITDLRRPVDPDGSGCGYPLRIAGEWAFRHPDQPVIWRNTAHAGDKVMDLEARWQRDVLDTRPDVLSILVGVNDMAWHTLDPAGYVIPVEEFEAGYRRLLEPLAEAGTELIMIEPFLLPVPNVRVDEETRRQWRIDLEPRIEVVHALADKYGAHLLAADRMFTELAATTDPAHWSADGVHPTSAGHRELAEAWLRLVG